MCEVLSQKQIGDSSNNNPFLSLSDEQILFGKYTAETNITSNLNSTTSSMMNTSPIWASKVIIAGDTSESSQESIQVIGPIEFTKPGPFFEEIVLTSEAMFHKQNVEIMSKVINTVQNSLLNSESLAH